VTQLIASSLERKQMKAPSMKLILYAGQLISREFKENMTRIFKGIPFVS